MDLKEIKEIVSIAAAIVEVESHGRDTEPIDVHGIDRRAFEIAHRIELVLQRRADRNALED